MKKLIDGMLTEFGMTCSTCLPGIRDREHHLYLELLEEDVFKMPAFFDIEAFERYILKLAIHYLSSLGAEHIQHLRMRNPILLRPRLMALWMKEQVTNLMPMYYVSSMEAQGKDRLFHGGTYEFKKAVPSEIVMDALKRAEFIKVMEGEDGAV
jgi:hypothetical protein